MEASTGLFAFGRTLSTPRRFEWRLNRRRRFFLFCHHLCFSTLHLPSPPVEFVHRHRHQPLPLCIARCTDPSRCLFVVRTPLETPCVGCNGDTPLARFVPFALDEASRLSLLHSSRCRGNLGAGAGAQSTSPQRAARKEPRTPKRSPSRAAGGRARGGVRALFGKEQKQKQHICRWRN